MSRIVTHAISRLTFKYPEVSTFTDLPTASSSPGGIYVVLTSTGLWPFNRKLAGMWRSNGVAWIHLGDYPQLSDLVNPPGGYYKVTNLYVNTTGKVVVEYDDTPV